MECAIQERKAGRGDAALKSFCRHLDEAHFFRDEPMPEQAARTLLANLSEHGLLTARVRECVERNRRPKLGAAKIQLELSRQGV